jgi:hypothetical protein
MSINIAIKHTISRLVTLALVAGCASEAGAVPVPSRLPIHFASNATIWFHPNPATVLSPAQTTTRGGSVDFSSLFDPSSQWPNVTAHTSVFGLYAGWVIAATDQQLASVVNFLNAHNMSIELEAPSLQATAQCGNGVEGYVPSQLTVKAVTLDYLDRLQALNANVAYIKVDEPFFYGSVPNIPGSCEFPLQTTATEVSQFAQIVATVYPKAQVGDVEPILRNGQGYKLGAVQSITQWHQAYAVANGAPFPFFFADIDFSYRGWPDLTLMMERTTRANKMQFGIIYIGDRLDLSSAEWSAKVVSRFQTYQGVAKGKPDYVLFQSWERYPTYCLPETAPTTFTNTINTFLQETAVP